MARLPRIALLDVRSGADLCRHRCRAGLAGGRAEAAAGIPFLPHQALYDLSLVKSRGSQRDRQRPGTHSL